MGEAPSDIKMSTVSLIWDQRLEWTTPHCRLVVDGVESSMPPLIVTGYGVEQADSSGVRFGRGFWIELGPLKVPCAPLRMEASRGD
jgi:hypothetical protein